jgi:uncharacterized membrane protein YdjX (TVP38/TMEM64 family)
MSFLKRWWPVLLTALLFLILFFLSKLVPDDTARNFINDAGKWGPLILFLLFLISYILAPLNGSPLLFAGYYAYGANIVFIATSAAILSFIINFWIARKWGRSYIQRLVGPKKIKHVDKLAENYGLLSLFFLRFFQGGLHDFVSYAAGLTSMRFKSYMAVSLLAEIPGTAIWYYIVSKAKSPATFTVLTWVMTISFTVVFLLGIFIVRQVRRSDKAD